MQIDSDDTICDVCYDILLLPAQLKCKHVFCCYCICSIRYKNQDPKCPMCKNQMGPPIINAEKQNYVVNQVFENRKDIKIFLGSAQTINHNDKNQTNSKPFYFLLKDNKIQCDIMWGGGTVHSSYDGQIGRGIGSIKRHQNGDLQFESFRSQYSNTPYQNWFGTLKLVGPGQYKSQNCTYTWYGWNNRKCTGILNLSLEEWKKS